MGHIEVKNFKKSFGKKTVHSDISFYVKKGECLGLIGGSGAGKSVILRSLIGLEKPDYGSIEIDGTDISNFNEKQLVNIRKKVAYVFQGGALFDSMTVYENLAYPLREHTQMTESEIKEKVRVTLTDLGLSGNDQIFPSQLSGGMQKRVGLARAIIMNPDVILYDEPTAGLDPYNTIRIQEIILKLKAQGVTSILVTHDMPTALAVCDKFAMISKGHIVAQGTLEQIEKSQGNLIQKFMQGEAA